MVKNMSTARREEMPDMSESPMEPNTAPAQPGLPGELDPDKHESARMLARALRWRTIWPQVIAHAWADQDFKAALKDDACKAIKARFNYELSPELKLIIEDAQCGTYNPDAEPGKDRWKGLPQMELKLYIPPAPELKHQAIALTHYSETGRTYPMTSA
jgi:ribosomally synthesized peptide (two-chain TOMM family)